MSDHDQEKLRAIATLAQDLRITEEMVAMLEARSKPVPPSGSPEARIADLEEALRRLRN
jgi:hypothetical protein